LKLLLDTHVWLWLVAGDTRLKPRLRSLLQHGQTELWLSPISVWEAMMLAQKNRIVIDAKPAAWAQQMLAATGAREAALTHEVAIRSRTLSLTHADPADRFLVATALAYGLKLVTADANICKAKPCEVVAA